MILRNFDSFLFHLTLLFPLQTHVQFRGSVRLPSTSSSDLSDDSKKFVKSSQQLQR